MFGLSLFVQFVFSFIDLGSQVRRPTFVWMVQEHYTLVGIFDSLLGGCWTDTCK